MSGNKDDSSSDDDLYCPALPPNFKKPQDSGNSSERTNQPIGPFLPPSMRHLLDKAADGVSSTNSVEISQDVENNEDDSDSTSDSEIIGPLPPDHPLAQRAAASSVKTSSDSDKKLKREEWMLVPPKNKPIASLGLATRKFLARTPADSRPDDQDEAEIEEELERAAIEQQIIDQYDGKMEKMKEAAATKSKRGAESLYEIHQKELKRKRKEEVSKGPAERRTFDRDTDLKVSGLSSDDRMKYIQKSRELDTKFTKGKRKFL